MTSPWLLLDVSYLAYRAYFAIGGKLSHGDIATSVVYGVLREVITLQETFNTKRLAFCFDYGKPLRSELHPGYKQSRHTGKTAAELESILEVKQQIQHLRKDYLGSIGYRNLLFQKGFEADDVIASLTQSWEAEFVIVSSDHDLYQCLAPNVRIWQPASKTLYTQDTLRKEFGINPEDWVQVKAIAGCKSDDIPGIVGIGEKTAAKYLRGDLKPGKHLAKIEDGRELWKRNLKLVRLPFKGIPILNLRKDEVTAEGWTSLIDRLGMNSLAGSIPGIPRRKASNVTRATLGVW